jgi:hypothetical protein
MIELLLAVSLVTKGTIYFAEKDCDPTTGSTFEIKPSDVARRFVWTSGDARTSSSTTCRRKPPRSISARKSRRRAAGSRRTFRPREPVRVELGPGEQTADLLLPN